MAALRFRWAALLWGAACLAVASGAAAAVPRAGGFAARLADQRAIAGPELWPRVDRGEALARVADASAGERQAARWRYALSLLGSGRAADALGVLDVMVQDEADVGLAPNFQLARGRALVELGRVAEALAQLSGPRLALNPEAAAWRMRAHAMAADHGRALRELVVARAALVRRSAEARAPFVLTAAESAMRAGRPDVALRWLRFVPPADGAARIVRGEALLALGRAEEAAAVFRAALREARGAEAAAARFGLLEAELAARRVAPGAALRRAQDEAYRWRGDETERRALWLAVRLSRQLRNDRAALGASAALVRYHPGERGSAALSQGVAELLGRMLAPDSTTSLPVAAGLYWDFRDLAPVGAAGDMLVQRLAFRLAKADLHERAAQLLEYQLFERAQDLAKGPLSVRVAQLHILGGKPQRALEALHGTAAVIYPQAMDADRRRMEAIALYRLGRGAEAVALLAEVPGAEALRAELLWKMRDWNGVAARPLPSAATTEVQQAVILRHAIALSMTGREPELSRLRTRYLRAFRGLPTEAAFEVLTAPVGAARPEAVDRALAALPQVSPAGADADLLDL